MLFGRRLYNTGPYNGSGGTRTLEVEHGFQVVLSNAFELDHGFRVGMSVRFELNHGFQVSMGEFIVEHGIRVVMTNEFELDHGIRVKLPAGEFYEAFLKEPGDVRAVLYRTYGLRILLHNLDDDTVLDATPYVTGWKITQNRSAAADASITLGDVDRFFIPRPRPDSPWKGKLDGDAFDDSYQVRRYWTIHIASAGEWWEDAPHFLQLDRDWNHDSANPVVTLTLTDYSELLLPSEEELDDFISTLGALFTAKQVVGTILETFGVREYVLDFEDYELPGKFSPKGGAPLDWIGDLLWVRQAEWYWKRDVFIARARKYSPTGPADYEFLERYHLIGFKYKQSTRSLKNEFTVRKLNPMSDVLAEIDVEGSEAIGFVPVDITPSRNARVQLETVAHGHAKDFVWFGEGGRERGEILHYGSNTYGGSTPAHHVRFVYEPIIDVVYPGQSSTGWQPRILGAVIGIPADLDPIPTGVDPAFSVTVKNTPSQRKFGRRRDKTPIAHEYIPNKEVAQQTAQLLLEESLRTMEQTGWNGVLFPFVIPGMTIKITEGWAGIRAENYYVESITKQGDQNAGTMDLDCSQFAEVTS
jgi:hypothetical protein